MGRTETENPETENTKTKNTETENTETENTETAIADSARPKTSKPETVGRGQVVLAIAAACVVFAIMQGIHDNYGITINGLMANGYTYYEVSTIIAVGAFLYGIGQPFFGMLAIRKSNAYVMCIGILLMAAGLLAAPHCHTVPGLLLFYGIVLPAGTAALCLSIVLGAVAPLIGEARAAAASGIVQASAGIGDALMSPALQRLVDGFGIRTALTVFSIPILLLLPFVIWLGKAGQRRRQTEQKISAQNRKEKISLWEILREAAHQRYFWCLLIGFSTCGFNMSIIETHLFNEYVAGGIPAEKASLILTVYGITTMIGAALTGYLGSRFNTKNVLGCVYGTRVFISLAFLVLPISLPFAVVATALLGMAGDSTVPPTVSIITKRTGIAKMAVVYGTIFIGHQTGAFFSAWLGGILKNSIYGYRGLWAVNLCLCCIASIASFSIRNGNAGYGGRSDMDGR